jgi:hypothetical protein
VKKAGMKRVFRKITTVLLSIIVPATIIYFTDYIAGFASAGEDINSEDTTVDRYIENAAFGLGEKLSFDIGYGFINAGYATTEVVDVVEFNSRPCYLVVSTAKSNKFFSSFYKVDDRVESVIDAVGIFSWYFEKKLREGTYSSDRSYEFDQANHRVVYKNDTMTIAPYVQDALSVMYYARTQSLNIGQSIYIDSFTDGKHYTMEVKVIGKERIKVKAGTFDCIVVEPLLMSPGIFKHEGRLKVWLTDDHLKLPVLMKSRVLVGSISAELTDYELGEILEF